MTSFTKIDMWQLETDKLVALYNSPQHQHCPTTIDKYVGSLNSPDRTLKD